MNTPLSFVPDEETSGSVPSSFVPDNTPSSFQPDNSPVLNQNETGFLTPDLTPKPSSYGDAVAQGVVKPEQLGLTRSTVGDVVHAPGTLIGMLTAEMLNQMADKSTPDIQQQAQFPNVGHYRSGLQQKLFGPSNLNVLGKDPNAKMFSGERSILPEPTATVGTGSAENGAMNLVRGLMTPEQIPQVVASFGPAAPLVAASYALQTAADLPQMSGKEMVNNALMFALPMAVHKGFGVGAPEKPVDTTDLQSTLQNNQIPSSISRPSVTTVKEAIPVAQKEQIETSNPTTQPSNIGTETLDPTKVQFPLQQTDTGWADQMNRPVELKDDASVGRKVWTLTSEGGQPKVNTRENVAPLVGEQLPPATTSSPEEIGKKLGLKVAKWPDELPQIGGTYSFTDPKTGFTVEGFKPGVTADEVAARLKEKGGDTRGQEEENQNAQKQVGVLNQREEVTKSPIGSASSTQPEVAGVGGGMTDESGSFGLHVLDPDEWKGLGFKGKVAAEQFINRLRNKLGSDSSAYKMIDTPEFRSFMQSGPKTTEEVQKWVNDNGPRVEVRKLEAKPSTEYTPEEEQLYENEANLRHQIESLGWRIDTSGRLAKPGSDLTYERGNPNIPKEVIDLWDKHEAASNSIEDMEQRNRDIDRNKGESATARYTMVNPKPLDKMPGAVDLLVRVPQNLSKEQLMRRENDANVKYTSSHYPTEGKNLLAHVRGYMETMPDGKKVFHVFEVQSDWGQHVREEQAFEKKYPNASASSERVTQQDPLLQHYERLALKAAIEHARENGASAVAISDAETAMLTEGHDRMATQHPEGWNYQEPEQAAGMRLHYDRTLPKIAEELTGSKGQRVEFGEHQNAIEQPTQSSRQMMEEGEHREGPQPRQDLIFRNSDGTPKTSITARMYDISKAKEDLSILSKDKPTTKLIGNQKVSGESGMINLSGARESLDKTIEGVKDFLSKERIMGVSAPKTTRANEGVGNQLTRFAQGDAVAEAMARSKATQVLGDKWNDKDFSNLLGAVMVEDRLRTLKDTLTKAGKTAEATSVNTLIGQPYSPLKSEAQYKQLVASKNMQDAFARHKAEVQALAEQNHTALGGKLSMAGNDTGTFLNLVAKENNSGELSRMKQGNTMATLKGGTRFGKEFKGTGTEYETDYRKLAERMVKGNWTEVEKQKLFKDVEKSGMGFLQKAGQDLPNDVSPKTYEPIPIQRKTAVIVSQGADPVMKSQNQTLWIPKRYAEEFRQAFQTDSPVKKALVADLVTKVQTSLGADAAFHVGNQMAAVLTSPEKATAVKRMVGNLAETFNNSPEVQKRLSDMAEQAGIVRGGEDVVAGWRKLIPGKHLINWFDQAGRLTLDSLYQDAVKRGESPDSPVWRRAAVQGSLGEYNKRLMTKWEQIAKESGASPFLTAGKTFNKLALRQMLLSPGRKALDAEGGAKMRMKQALYVGGLVVAAPMMINYQQTGNPFPPGVQPGQFVVKKNEDGSYVVEDVAQLFMIRRGLRNTGIQALSQGIQDRKSVGQIGKQMVKDVARGVVRPYAGPAVSALDTVTGANTLVDRPNQPSLGKRSEQAVKQLNPTASLVLDNNPSKTTQQKTIGRFGRTIGLATTSTAVQRIGGLVRDWKERNGLEVDNSPQGPYAPLVSALRNNDADGARKARQELLDSGKKPQDVVRYINEYPHSFGNLSHDQMKKFEAELSDEDRKDLDVARKSNQTVQNRWYQIFGGRQPREQREERESRSKR